MALRIREISSPSYWQDNYLGVIPPADSSKCTTFNGYKLCENDPIASLIGSPTPSINHLAKTVDVNLESCGPLLRIWLLILARHSGVSPSAKSLSLNA